MASNEEGFRIELTSTSDRWWRFNIELLCEALDEGEQRIAFCSAHSTIAEIGVKPQDLPDNPTHPNPLRLTTPPCDHARLFLYLIPHTLPDEREVEAAPPFPAVLSLYYNRKLIHREIVLVNQWCGASRSWTLVR